MAGKVCIVTGANSGVGLMTALELAKQGAHTFLACRSETRAAEAIEQIRGSVADATVEYLPLDLASLASVRHCAAQFKRRNLPLHVLVNNAGVFFGHGLTQEGFNTTVGINYIGHFLLTHLLLESLEAAASARIVLVASDTASQVTAINWNLLFTSIFQYPIHRYFTDTLRVYALSKLCVLMFMTELSEQIQDRNITVNAVHPGFVQSNISVFHRWSKGLGIGVSPAEGARSPLFCAAAPELDRISGKFFDSDRQETQLPPLAQDRDRVAELWQRSLNLVGLETTGQATKLETISDRSVYDDSSLRYDGTDGIWGPFKLHVSPANIEAMSEAIATQIVPNAPFKVLWRSLIESWLKSQGIMPTFFSFFQFFTGRYYIDRHLDSSLVRSLCTDLRLRQTLRDFLGDRFLLWRSEIWISKPGRKIVSFWHQDCYKNYLKGSGRAITAYLALTEVNELNGMKYMPKTHIKSGEVCVAERELEVIRIAGNHHFTVPKELEGSAISVCLQPGEFVLFDEQLVHCSIKNQTTSDRISMAVRFVQDDVEVLRGFSPIQADPIPLTAQ